MSLNKELETYNNYLTQIENDGEDRPRQERVTILVKAMLQQTHDVVANLPENELDQKELYERLLFSLNASSLTKNDIHSHIYINRYTHDYPELLSRLIQAIASSAERADKNGPESLLSTLCRTLIDHPHIPLVEQINMTIGKGKKRIQKLTSLIDSINIHDPNEGPVILSTSEDGESELHIVKTSTDPVEQRKQILQGLNAVRTRELMSQHTSRDVRGISRLVHPKRQKLFKAAGFSADKGATFSYYDLNSILASNDPYRNFDLSKTTVEELLYVSCRNIMDSPHNLRRFLLHRQLPDVGIITIPRSIFFNDYIPNS